MASKEEEHVQWSMAQLEVGLAGTETQENDLKKAFVSFFYKLFLKFMSF